MNDLITTDQLEDYLDTTLNCNEAQLDTAVGVLRSHCRWHVAPTRPDTHTIIEFAGRRLWVPTLRLVTVDEVTVDGQTIDGVKHKRNGLIVLPQPVAGAVTVTFTHGFPVAEVMDIIGYVAGLSARIAPAVTPTAAGTVAPVKESIVGYDYELPDSSRAGVALTDLEQIGLDRYRLPNDL